jgi:hypothetical protein
MIGGRLGALGMVDFSAGCGNAWAKRCRCERNLPRLNPFRPKGC